MPGHCLLATLIRMGISKSNLTLRKSSERLAKSAEGWEQLQFIAKTAEINSNARATIAEALVESGKWKDMTLEEKQVIVRTRLALQAIFDSESHLKTWNSMPAEVKELLLKNTDIMSKADEASKALSNYEALKPKQKELLANDESGPKSSRSLN